MLKCLEYPRLPLVFAAVLVVSQLVLSPLQVEHTMKIVSWSKVREVVAHLDWLMNDVTYKAPEQMDGCEEDLRRTHAWLGDTIGVSRSEDKAASVAIAADLAYSATLMMRSSNGALEAGDKAGARRAQTIAAREYEWASRLWSALGERVAAEKCRDLHDAVLVGTWTDPEVGDVSYRQISP